MGKDNRFSKNLKINKGRYASDDIRNIPYGHQWIDEEDIQAVADVLRSDWLTTGPMVEEFEHAVADYVGAGHAVAVSSGTAALHAAMFALGIGPGDEVIVPPMTFAATANCIVYQGGTPVFVDVDPGTLLIDPEKAEAAITENTKAIIAVDYTGQPCDYGKLRDISGRHGIALVADGCHALGAKYKGRKVGCLADLTVFSFHPVKHITTGEGGMITTNNEALAKRMRIFRNHGVTTDHRQRENQKSWVYEMVELGYNYRITDFQCALGLSQLRRLPAFVHRRREIADMYNQAFVSMKGVTPLKTTPDGINSHHLYVIRVKDRDRIFTQLRRKGIGVNVHYIPVHLQPYYQKAFGTGKGMCPTAEEAYRHILSLPVFPAMTTRDLNRVISSIEEALQ